VRWPAGSLQGRQLHEAIESQLRAFREKFGREPGPEDPVFFDPDAGEPRPLDEGAFTRDMTRALREAGAKAGLDSALVEAWCELGYVVTDDNKHLLSANEIIAWGEAVRRHAGILDEYDEGNEIDAGEESGEDSTGQSLGEIYDELEQVIVATIESKTLDAARGLIGAFASLLENADEDSGEQHGRAAGWTFQATFALLAGWLSGARENGLTDANARNALDWIRSIDTVAYNATDYALRAAGLIGHPDAPQDMTVNQLIDEMGPVVIGAMVLLVAGLVATTGRGDACWIRQFDAESSRGSVDDDK
jgi:hypothetical protein